MFRSRLFQGLVLILPGLVPVAAHAQRGAASAAAVPRTANAAAALVTTPNSMLCAGQTAYAQGQTVLVSYATARAAAKNWIGIYSEGQTPGNVGSLVWSYTPKAAGSVALSTSALSPGRYVAYYMYDNGYTQLANPVRFDVTASPAAGSPNLIVNGGGECGNASVSGYDGATIPGWQITGLPSVVGYDAGQGFPSPSTAGPDLRGSQFFSGGPVGNSTLQQGIDVSTAAAAIDGGNVDYELSGWLGGYSSETSWTIVTTTFLNARGAQLGTGKVGPVSAADRQNTTGLLERASRGRVPAGTRSISVTMEFVGESARNLRNQYNDSYADNLSLTLSTPVPAPAVPAPVASAVPSFDHVFFVILENVRYDAIIGSSSRAPYLRDLANANVALSQSYGLIHPSDPNYMAVAGGSTFGHQDNPMPGGIGTIGAPHLGDLVEGVGKSWRGYIEDMGTPCNLTKNGHYDPDNLPFLFFQNIGGPDRTRCKERIQPITQLWEDLKSAATTPNFVWFEPNSCNTMHDCAIATGDAWFKSNLPKILTSPAWTSQRSLLVITFDEDDNFAGQSIPTIVLASPGITKTGYKSQVRYTHYSVLRTIESALALGNMTQNDQFATPLNDIWR
ncbi:alkaline phosphatase family protein [Pendulispora rubella]|uniref:Alkaline phosphatase family protein n=1 Tax=Pendulispora rubella TaxID=2741070 RepID=A0ABZ2KT32_9BACT